MAASRRLFVSSAAAVALPHHRHSRLPFSHTLPIQSPPPPAAAMEAHSGRITPSSKIIDSHLHIWASPQEAADKYPYFPGQEPTLPGDVDFLLQCMEEAGVEGALIVQPINHKFDHSLLTSVLKKYPTKFVGCCLANPAEDKTGIKQLEQLVLEDGYRAVRFNPYLWPSGEKMTNEVGKLLFRRAGELGVPVGFMCFKGLNLHILEIEQLCTEFPSTPVLIDHLGFCKPPTNDEEKVTFSNLLNLSRFPQVYVKFSALFRVSRIQYPYNDLSHLLSQVVSSFGANRIMWGSDFPFVVPECGYNGAKEAVNLIASQVELSDTEKEWVMVVETPTTPMPTIEDQSIFSVQCEGSDDIHSVWETIDKLQQKVRQLEEKLEEESILEGDDELPGSKTITSFVYRLNTTTQSQKS